MHIPKTWSLEHANHVREMASKGYGDRAIAEFLGKSKNSVVSFRHRNKIPLNTHRSLTKRTPYKSSIKQTATKLIPKLVYGSAHDGKTIVRPSIEDSGCQYLHGDARARNFCRKEIKFKEYCAEHAADCIRGYKQ